MRSRMLFCIMILIVGKQEDANSLHMSIDDEDDEDYDDDDVSATKLVLKNQWKNIEFLTPGEDTNIIKYR